MNMIWVWRNKWRDNYMAATEFWFDIFVVIIPTIILFRLNYIYGVAYFILLGCSYVIYGVLEGARHERKVWDGKCWGGKTQEYS